MAGENSARAPKVSDAWGGVRAAFRGVPVAGDLMDEGLAAYHATFGGDRSKSWGRRWNDEVEEERAYDAAYDAKHPYLSAALQTAGGLAVPTGLLAGKIPAAARGLRWVGRQLMAAPKSKLAREMAGEAVLGAAEGAVDGFAAGEGGLGARLGHAGSELVRGATWGGLARPLLAKGLGKEVADGTRLRTGAREEQRLMGILGRIDVDSPALSMIPLPWQGH
jgi:hypothetical protein